MRTVGAVVRGIRTPIVREGDDLVTLVRDSVMAASETEHITFHDRDIVAVTESVVARAAGNYATVQNIADDVKAKFGCDHIGVIFPKPLCHRAARHRHRHEKDHAHAQLPFGRSRKPSL